MGPVCACTYSTAKWFRLLCMYNIASAQAYPHSLQVRGVHVDTAGECVAVPVYPHTSPLLTSHAPKDPVAAENAGHGPKAMSTEYHSQFKRQQFRDESKSVCNLHIVPNVHR